MSFAGALRIYLSATQPQPPRRREPEALRPIVEGRWAAWALRTRTLAPAAKADVQDLPKAGVRRHPSDASVGIIPVLIDGGGSTNVGQVVVLERVRRQAWR
jgi:hypothetical protein